MIPRTLSHALAMSLEDLAESLPEGSLERSIAFDTAHIVLNLPSRQDTLWAIQTIARSRRAHQEPTP